MMKVMQEEHDFDPVVKNWRVNENISNLLEFRKAKATRKFELEYTYVYTNRFKQSFFSKSERKIF